LIRCCKKDSLSENAMATAKDRNAAGQVERAEQGKGSTHRMVRCVCVCRFFVSHPSSEFSTDPYYGLTPFFYLLRLAIDDRDEGVGSSFCPATCKTKRIPRRADPTFRFAG
jgi:hypothetical protein